MPKIMTPQRIAALLPPRPEKGHKGSFGHVAVVAGSVGFTGAVRLACMAAYRSGAGLVTAAVPHRVLPFLAAAMVEPMLFGLKDTKEGSLSYACRGELAGFLENKSSVVLGLGLSTHYETTRLVRHVYHHCGLPLVVDADGLNALAEFPGRLVPTETKQPSYNKILTPHPGEMSRLSGLDTAAIQKERLQTAAYFAALWQVVLVLKGHETVVAAPDGQVQLCPTGNQGMATGGSGDVLSGICGALLGQGLSAYDAACVGVYAHGLAGDLAAQEKNARSLIASDIIEMLPQAWTALESVE